MHNITKMELLGLEAHLQLEENNISIFNHYAEECQDSQIKNFCQQTAAKRMQAMQMLVSSMGANIQ